MLKRFITTFLVTLLIINFCQPYNGQAASNGTLTKVEIDRLLGVEESVNTTEKQEDIFFENLPELLTLDDNELLTKLDELKLSDVVELSDEPLVKHNGTSTVLLGSEGDSLSARLLVPTGESFHADFINKMVTSTFFNVDLFFYNLCKSRITQFAGYVNYQFERSIGSWMNFTAPYIDAVNIPIGPMKVHSYSYTHYNCNALYEGNFVVVYKGVPYTMLPLTEHK